MAPKVAYDRLYELMDPIESDFGLLADSDINGPLMAAKKTNWASSFQNSKGPWVLLPVGSVSNGTTDE